MELSTINLKNQEGLKQELQNEPSSKKLENLAAALIGRLLNVPIAVAKSGFQHGGDAGPGGRQGRRFRVECKKYKGTTSLKSREILGEIDQALGRDEALEAWFLVSTRSVDEQLEQDLFQKSETIGVPVVVLDWKENTVASLAALCAFDPDLVEAEFSKKAGEYARALGPVSADSITMLRRNLQSWCLGFEALRKQSHDKLDKIWNSPRVSNAELAQNAAGGAQNKKVRRNAVHEALNNWWQGEVRADAPTAVVGWDGVGKTWAVLDWLVESKVEQPVVLVVPSSAATALSSASEIGVKRFLAERLYELSGARSSVHWLRRIDYLLKRPTDEGPVLTVFFDGINQEPSLPWLSLLKALQGEIFASRIRVIVSTRNHYFNDKLSKLRGLVVPAILITVNPYDTEQEGELDQMLRFESLTQKDLHPDLIELARVPRLFNLVVRFRDRLIDAGQVTVHRLLWEYGRDTLGERAGKSFSEGEWKEWLKEIAQKYRDGIREFSVKSLGETASRPDLSGSEVYARLSDIIDGRFAIPGPSGSLQLTPTVVAHALGTALLAHLDTVATPTFETLDVVLGEWLDPIAGLDQRAEILRAAVSIVVERSRPVMSQVSGVLVTAWLQTQNVTDAHRKELAILAPCIPDAVLDAVEHSEARTHASAQLWAVNALRAIPRSDEAALEEIVKRLCLWFGVVSRDVDPSPKRNSELERNRSDKFKRRIGIDRSGPITVVGVKLKLVTRTGDLLQALGSSIIEGFALSKAKPVFEVAAVAFAVGGGHNRGWEGLKWLCLLNEVDPDETAASLRALSDEVLHRKSESGVHQDLPARAAALLLWMTGHERDEDVAVSLNPDLNGWPTYRKDYLPQPGHSIFPLERRHAKEVLNDTELSLIWRIQRTKDLWLDPTFDPPPDFIKEMISAATNIDVEKLDRNSGQSIEDHNFKELEPVLARLDPNVLGKLLRDKMRSIATCSEKSRYWSAIGATKHMILAGKSEAGAARALRRKDTELDENDQAYAHNQLLLFEIEDLDVQAQFDVLIQADLKFILSDLKEVLRPPSSHEVDELITRYAAGSPKQQDDLLILFSIHSLDFSDKALTWIEGFAKNKKHELCGLAFETLTRADPSRFGRMLVADDWSWDPGAHFWINHYGTGALIEATRNLHFEQVAPRLAPWRLLEAVRLRGTDPFETRIAAELLDNVLTARKIEEPDPGSLLSIERKESKSLPFTLYVSPRPAAEDADDPFANLKLSMDSEKRAKAYNRAIKTAQSRIDEARASGASLYLTEMNPKDFVAVYQHAPDMIDQWIEGYQECTDDFQRRVRLAEAAFMALCEALLSYAPKLGTELWRALLPTVTTRYIGKADVDDLTHMIFRVPDSPEVIALREELLGLERCHTDQALFDLQIAASYNEKAEWLSSIIETDRLSKLIWRRKRAAILAGFASNNTFPIPDAWPEGELRTGYVVLEHKSARFRWIEACAHHWWSAYLAAQNPSEAYAAWVLFLRSADHRAWIWMKDEMKASDSSDTFLMRKLSHARLNRSELKQAMKKRTDKFDQKFLDRNIAPWVGPWGNETDSVSTFN